MKGSGTAVMLRSLVCWFRGGLLGSLEEHDARERALLNPAPGGRALRSIPAQGIFASSMKVGYRSIALLALALGPIFAAPVSRELDVTKIPGQSGWTLHHASGTSVAADGRSAVRLQAAGDSATRIAGLAVSNLPFTTGTIEVDLKGKNVRQKSFLGVAFNIADERTFEAIYFRPFNFKGEPPTDARAVQYIAWPDNTWEKLRAEKPGQFENRVNPVPDPAGWFHARIEVGDKQVKVFVNQAEKPSLTVTRLVANGGARPVGLFVDVDDGHFANLKVTPAK